MYCWLNTDKVTCFRFFQQKLYRNVPHRTTIKLITEFALQDIELNCVLAIREWAVLYDAILWFWWIDIELSAQKFGPTNLTRSKKFVMDTLNTLGTKAVPVMSRTPCIILGTLGKTRKIKRHRPRVWSVSKNKTCNRKPLLWIPVMDAIQDGWQNVQVEDHSNWVVHGFCFLSIFHGR